MCEGDGQNVKALKLDDMYNKIMIWETNMVLLLHSHPKMNKNIKIMRTNNKISQNMMKYNKIRDTDAIFPLYSEQEKYKKK